MELFNLLAKLTLDTNEFDKDLDQAERDLKAIDAPDPKLGLDNDEFNSNIEESQTLGDSFGQEMGKVFSGIKTALTVTGIVGAIAGIVNGIKEAVNLTAQTADGIDKGAKKLGISRVAYQEWDHALRQSGSSIDDVKKGLMNMQLAIQAANPATAFADAEDQVDGLADKAVGLSQDAYEALRDLGLLSKLQAGEFHNAEELMDASLKALAGYDGSTDDRGILVRKLFGKGGDNLNALLDEGVSGVEDLLAEAGNLGLIMSDEEINNAVAYGDAVANLNAELDAIKTAFVADIIPVLKDAATWLTDFLAKFNPRNSTNSIDKIFEDIDNKTLKASHDIDEANVTAKALIEDLQNMGDYWTLDEQGKMTWDALAEKALDLFPKLSDYIDKDGKKIQGNTEDIEKNIDAWARLEKQRLLTAAMEEKRAAVAKQLTDAYEKGADASVKMDEAEGKRVVTMKALNDLLTSESTNGNVLQMQKEFGARFGTLNNENFAEAADWFSQNYAVLDYGLRNQISDWQSAATEANNLRETADKMIAAAEEADANLDNYQIKLAEQMGLTKQNILKTEGEVDNYTRKLNNIPRNVVTVLDVEEGDWHPRAIGGTIPYDNYPALLHRGEKVLTATDVRRMDQPSAGTDHLEERIAAAIRNGMEGATVRSFLNGRDITEEVNRQNMNSIKGRRFAG